MGGMFDQGKVMCSKSACFLDTTGQRGRLQLPLAVSVFLVGAVIVGLVRLGVDTLWLVFPVAANLSGSCVQFDVLRADSFWSRIRCERSRWETGWITFFSSGIAPDATFRKVASTTIPI